MDNTTYVVNGNMPSRTHTCADAETMFDFLHDILSGTLTDFSLASFFQQNSDYITSISFYPVDTNLFIGASATLSVIPIGNKLATATNPVKSVVYWKNYVQLFSLSIARTFNNFLDFEPYTRIKLSIPYFGFIDIPTEYAYTGYLNGYVAIDFSSGKSTLYIYWGATSATTNTLVTTKTVQLSIDVPLGKTNAEEQNRNKVLHGIQAGISGGIIALGVSAGNPLITGAGIAKAGQVVTNAFNDSLIRLTSYDGGDGNTSSLAVDKSVRRIVERPQQVVYPDAHLVGKPCRQTLALSGLTGFTKVGDIHFEPNGEEIYQDEIAEIVDLLHKGVIL